MIRNKIYCDLEDIKSNIIDSQINIAVYIKEVEFLLKEVYDYIDVENEGTTKEQYKLVEKIRRFIDE